jgi:clan AA aspartic protease
MGLFQVQIEVLPADGGLPQPQSVLVDTGASYLTLPRSLLTSLGYRAIDRQRVIFATGAIETWEVAEVRVRLGERERTVLAFLAPEESPKLLGAQTLETFGLGVDPLGKRLVPVDAYLAPAHPPLPVSLHRPHPLPSWRARAIPNVPSPSLRERGGVRVSGLG